MSKNAFGKLSISVPLIGCPVVSVNILNFPFSPTPPSNPVTLYPDSSTFVITSLMSEYKLSPSVTSAPAVTIDGINPALQSAGLSVPLNIALSIFFPNASTILGFTSDQISIDVSFNTFSLIGTITANSAALIYFLSHAIFVRFFLPLFVDSSTKYAIGKLSNTLNFVLSEVMFGNLLNIDNAFDSLTTPSNISFATCVSISASTFVLSIPFPIDKFLLYFIILDLHHARYYS